MMELVFRFILLSIAGWCLGEITVMVVQHLLARRGDAR